MQSCEIKAWIETLIELPGGGWDTLTINDVAYFPVLVILSLAALSPADILWLNPKPSSKH